MKAIEIRLNKMPYTNDKGEKDLYNNYHNKHDFMAEVYGNGCPRSLGEHFTIGCVDGCTNCWNQEPYQYREEHPEML